MKRFFLFFFACCILSTLFAATSQAAPAGNNAAGVARTDAASSRSLWVTGYYAGWKHKHLEPADIDFNALTHLVHFSVLPKADGTLDTTQHDITPARSTAIIRATHNAKRKILLCVGGEHTANEFRGAISAANRTMFIKNLMNIVTERGYDGLDIDMEPVEARDTANYSAFIRELRAAMRAAKSGLLLTCAVGDDPQPFKGLQNEFDQINLMTYSLSGPWPGWETWHNAALFNRGVKFKSTNGLMPTSETHLQKWLDAGFNTAQLGIGVAFYGTIWRGATGPNQSIEGVTMKQIDYDVLMRDYFQPERYRWDEKAQAPYLSIDEPGTANDIFISYDDERLVAMKIDFARAQGLGGVIIWELGSGYRADAPAGKRDVLLQTIKRAAFKKPKATTKDTP